MAKVRQISSGVALVTTAGATQYTSCCTADLTFGTESIKQILYRAAGTLSGLYLRVNTNSTSTSSTLRTRKNTANGNQSVSIGAAATGVFEDTVNTDSITAGDTLAYQSISGGTGTYTIGIIATTFAATTNTVMVLGCSDFADLTTASSTTWHLICGQANPTNGQTPESKMQYGVKKAGTWSNLYLQVSANARTTTTTIKSRKNTADGTQVLTIGSTATGVFEDTTHTDTIAVDDIIDIQTVTGTGTQTMTNNASSTHFTTVTNDMPLTASGQNAVDVASANTTQWLSFAGSLSPVTTSEATQKAKAGVAFTLNNLITRFTSNTVTAATTVTLRISGVSGNLTVSVASSTTGLFQDITHSDTCTATDDLNYQLVVGATGTSISWSFVGVNTHEPLETKLYLHNTTSGIPSGTLPSAEQSTKTVTTNCNFEGSQTTNRLMDTTIGTSQASLALATPAGAGPYVYYVSRWVSPVIYQTSVAAGTWVYNFAASQSSASSNFPCSGSNNPVWVNCYVWKPSNGTKYGTILDGNTAATINEQSAGVEGSQQATFSGSAVSSLTSGDACIIFEAWFEPNYSTGISYTNTYYYDGTTETAGGSTVSNHASFLLTYPTITFAAAGTLFNRPLSTETISVSESLAEIYNANRAPSAETIVISESQARAFIGVRALSTQTNTIGESITRLYGANRAPTTETVTIGEALARLYNAIRAPTAETNTIGESLARLLSLNRPLTAETTTVSESLVRVFGVVRALSDTKTIGESLARLYAATRALSVETTIIGESLARSLGAIRSLSDTTVIGESLTRVLAAIRALAAQTTTVGESLARSQVVVRSLSDTTIISETINRLLAAIRALSAETNAIGESLTKVFTPASGVTFTRPLAAETIAISESIVRVTTNIRSIIDTTTIGESLLRVYVGIRALGTDTTPISESITSIKTLVRTLSQTSAISESLTKLQTLGRTLLETTVINETLTRLQVLRRALTTEISPISESLSRLLPFVRTLSQSTTISESLTKFADRTRTLIETVIITESLTTVQALTRTLATEITSISGSVVAKMGAFEMALIETVLISESLVFSFLHILKGLPLYLQPQKGKRPEGVGPHNRANERDSPLYLRKQLDRIVKRIYGFGRTRSG